MERIWNFFTGLNTDVQPVTDFTSEQPLSAVSEDNAFDTRDAQNEQTMGKSSNDEPMASSRNDQTDETKFSREVINDFRNDDPRRLFDSEEESCKENADTRNIQERTESELYSGEESGEENFQESLDSFREDNSTENEGPLQNQESVVNLAENSSHYQPTEFKKPDEDMLHDTITLVSKPVILNTNNNIVKLPQQSPLHMSGLSMEEQTGEETATLLESGLPKQDQSSKGNTDTKNVKDDPQSEQDQSSKENTDTKNVKDDPTASSIQSEQDQSSKENTDTKNVKDDPTASSIQSEQDQSSKGNIDTKNVKDDPTTNTIQSQQDQSSKENTDTKNVKDDPTASTIQSEQEQSSKENTDTKNVKDDPAWNLGGGLPCSCKTVQQQSNSGKENSDGNKQKFISLLSELKLNPQEKITLKKARSVDNYTFSDEALTSAEEIPKYILQKLMIVDYRARAFKLDNNGQEFNDSEQSNDEDDDKEEDLKGSINPMDAFLALFYCCDDFLRQDLVAKLSACQLSIPFLLPHPDQPTEKITMLLWALDGIKKSWKTNKDGNETFTDHEVFVMEHPFPIVSFIRIGKNEISKSGLLNKIISDVNGYHDFFFHKNCRGGGVERRIVDGLVELCWYLPGGRKQQAFEREICFANLRGDARKFSKQFNLLSQISSVILLLLPSEYPDPSTRQILEEAMKAKGKIVLIFNEKRQEKAKGYFDNLKNANRDKCSTISRAVKKNEDDFVVAIRAKIGRNAEDTEPVPLRDLTFLANDYKILLDESGYKTNTKTQWHKSILKWFTKGPKEAKRQFRLQLQVPIIAFLERENVCPTRRGNKSEEEYSNEIYNNIRDARNSQSDSFKQMDKGICKCINYIPMMDENERNYSLTVLKHNLDQMSLSVLGVLQADYRQTWFDTQRKKRERRQQNDSNKEQESIDIRRLTELEEAIKESSFGLEHFLREMAQLFQLTEIRMIDYAGVAANILLSGQPLELMDGDSSYIPLKWFNAVFENIEVITKNANIFVISVLGIQSSGKSTMLNTMFGLEFAVSSGRCTRGAFASLIPVSDSLKRESKYDYLLVIDTEGLRGSSDPQLRQHDNELATFAIGAADLTIVNIFGENYNEMEFLEIAVHAFLKMKLVKEKRICQIVHQNVAAINASNVLATERITLKNKLDEMTKLAAIQENCENEIEELNDVLSFDENEDVSYIPSLLQGCPPMAPMNPEYGKAVQKVKDKIIELMCLPERLPLTVSQFQKRVNGLWNAILRENFIFSFRNTIEVRAFTSLDQKFFEESVKTMVTQMAELEKTTSVSLMRSSAEARENIWEVQKWKINVTAKTLAGKMEKEMEVFFETNEDKATLEQWRENIMIKISQLKESQEAEVKKNCQAVFDYWQSRQEINNMKLVHEKELLANAKEFITSIEATDDVNAREQLFEQEWQKWIKKIPNCLVKKINVGKEMIRFLCNTNKKLDGPMNEKCKKQGFDIRNFKNYLPSIEHELTEVGLLERFLKLFRDDPQLVMDAEAIRDRAITSAINFAKDASRSGVRCRNSDLQYMYHIVLDKLKQGTEKKPFKFPNSLVCDALLCSFANAYDTFVEMEERYYRERDIKLELEENLKPKLQKYFMNMCNKMKKEVLAASSFADVLDKAIEQELNQSMGPAVAKEILTRAEFQSKGQFHAKVLIDLGEQNSFSAYIDYLRNPVHFLKEKLQESIKSYCTDQTDSTIASLLEKEIDKIKNKVFSAVFDTSKQIRANGKGIYCWIERFVENCSTLAITRDMFSVATIDEELKDLEVFENQVEKNLNRIFQDLLDQGVSESVLRTWNPTPFDKLVDLMFGCDECCPFCKALCDQTLRNHDKDHSTRNHRPQGITGYRDVHSNILDNTICTTSVGSASSYKNADTDEWHPYKDYKTVNDYYKSWSIAPDSSFEASSYWKWFMAKYSNDLAMYYGAKEPDIPSAWKAISFQEAKKQLRDQYNLG